MSAFKSMFKGIDTIMELAGDVHTISALFGAIQGKSVSDDAPAIAKGMSGVFGRKDEREMQRLMAQIKKEDQELLRRFFRWHYGDRKNWKQKLVAFWVMNSFNVFVTEKISYASKKGEETVTTTRLGEKKGEKTEAKTTKTLYTDPSDENALGFLNFMVEIIRDEIDLQRRKHPEWTDTVLERRGFKKLVEYFQDAGVPHMPPEGAENFVDWAYAQTSDAVKMTLAQLEEFGQRIDARHAEMLEARSDEGPFTRFMRRFQL